MGCTDAKSSRCEHVAAVSAFGEAMMQTTFELLDEACAGALSELGLRPGLETHIRPGVTGRREGVLR